MKVLLITFLLFGINSHDIQVAFYKIHQDNKNLIIDFIFEKEDILSALNEEDLKLSDKNLRKYINKNFIIFINNKPHVLSFEKMQIKEHHIYLKSNIPKIKKKIKSLEIKNTCLINIEDHSNIIEARLHGQERDFLMNTDRTSIKIKY